MNRDSWVHGYTVGRADAEGTFQYPPNEYAAWRRRVRGEGGKRFDAAFSVSSQPSHNDPPPFTIDEADLPVRRRPVPWWAVATTSLAWFLVILFILIWR